MILGRIPLQNLSLLLKNSPNVLKINYCFAVYWNTWLKTGLQHFFAAFYPNFVQFGCIQFFLLPRSLSHTPPAREAKATLDRSTCLEENTNGQICYISSSRVVSRWVTTLGTNYAFLVSPIGGWNSQSLLSLTVEPLRYSGLQMIYLCRII